MNFKCYPDNFIALYGDCATYTDAGSGLYINDLPGISLRTIASMANEEQVTASNLYQISHREGIRRFITDFKTGMSGTFNYRNILSAAKRGRLADTFSETEVNTEIGKKIEQSNCYDRFQKLYLEYFELNAEEAGEFTFKIVDDCVTTERTVTLICGINRILLDYEALSDTVYLVYDATGIAVPDTLKTNGSCGCIDDHCSCSGSYTGFSTSDVILSGDSYVSSNQKNGLVVAAQTRCSSYELSCIFKDESAVAIRYAIGIDLVRRAQFSDRNNLLERAMKDKAGELLVLWEGGTSEITGFNHKGEYHKERESIIKRAKTFLNNQVGETKCLECVGNRMVQIAP
jgi:hypothetical protein